MQFGFLISPTEAVGVADRLSDVVADIKNNHAALFDWQSQWSVGDIVLFADIEASPLEKRREDTDVSYPDPTLEVGVVQEPEDGGFLRLALPDGNEELYLAATVIGPYPRLKTPKDTRAAVRAVKDARDWLIIDHMICWCQAKVRTQ